MYNKRLMKFTSILWILLLTISCTQAESSEEAETKDTVIIEYQTEKDTLIIDTLKKKLNARNLWTPKCKKYNKWSLSSTS